jgi:hypothetical protein
LLSDFSGQIQVTIFDKRIQKQTLGTSGNPKMPYKTSGNLLFKGLVTVNQGKFQFSFIVPKDINYTFGKGKISLYAANTSQNLDANGGLKEIVIGGSIPNPILDQNPPQIQLWMNDTNFKSGDTVEPDAWLLAHITDESGINLSQTGIGHQILAVLDGDEENTKILNEFYTADLDTYQKGTLRYLWKDLTEGKHTLTLKVWDTHNNPTQQSIEFYVKNTASFPLLNLKNYPNPFKEQTIFSFEHNKDGVPLKVQINIYNLQGKMVKNIVSDVVAYTFSKVEVPWNGLDDRGNLIANGVYVYKIQVYSPDDKASGNAFGKLMVIH